MVFRHERARSSLCRRSVQRCLDFNEVYVVAVYLHKRVNVVEVPSTRVRGTPAHHGLELLGEHGGQRVRHHVDGTSLEHQGMRVLRLRRHD